MTAFAELEVTVNAIKRGAFDFIMKPLDPEYLIHSISKAETFRALKILEKNYKQQLQEKVKKKTKELSDLNREIIRRLTVVAEYRNTDTACISRGSGGLPKRFPRHLECPPISSKRSRSQGSLHDIGKVAIPDNILLKPGALTREEFDFIKTHIMLGANAFRLVPRRHSDGRDYRHASS